MNNKKLIHALTILSLLLYTAAMSSCSELVSELITDNGTLNIQPGQTAEINYRLVFSNDPDKNPGRKEIQRFSELPETSLSNPSFRFLSVSPQVSRDGISLDVIVIADDDLLSGSSTELVINWAETSAQTIIDVKKNPDAYIDSEGIITDPAAYDALVNKVRRLPSDYIPQDLVRVDVPTILVFEEVNHLRTAASDALSAMFLAADTEQGYELLARSGYRSYSTQVMLYDANVREHGEEYASRFSARPGTSEHQSGLVMDISSPVVNYQLTQDFGDTDEGKWVAENAHRFGFIVRYLEGKEEITGYTYEPWHLRWVGAELAGKIHSEGLTFEEYYSE